MGLSKRWASGSYWKQQHTIKTTMVVAVAAEANNAERFVGAKAAHTRGTNLFLGKQYQPHISNTKKAIVQKKAISSCTTQEQGLASVLLWEIPWWCGHVPCLCAIDASASTYRYCLYLWTKYYERELSSLVVKQDNRNGWRKKKIFFLFPFSARSIRALSLSVSSSHLPSVKYVYVINYKSMIGGCRTLLVMNSVNPLLIPLRYLNHVWVTSQQV